MVNPREYITNDKKIPVSMVGDAGKILAVDSSAEAYEHITMSSALIGGITMWPFDAPPVGYLMCKGDVVNYDDYPVLGALFGGVPAGTFTLPDIIFAKNSKGVNTNTVEAESVGTHGHLAAAVADHSHAITVNAAGNHSHSLSINSVSNHAHNYLVAVISYLNVAAGAYSVSRVTSATYSSSGGGGHTHSGSSNTTGNHSHGGSSADSGGHTPAITDHTGTNQPACTLVNFIIKY